MPSSCRLRIMTYNVHRCVGVDRAVSPDRIARVIARYEPDVIAVQELDVGHARTGYQDQPQLLAGFLEMRYHFHAAVETGNTAYGHAVYSRHPVELVRSAALPELAGRRREPRGAMWVRIDCRGQAVHLVNTHLGLAPRERVMQAEALLGRDWLGHADCRTPVVLCGDFNALPGTMAYRRLQAVLVDAQREQRLNWPRCTFPAWLPLARIDHVFLSRDWVVHKVQVPRTGLTRVASDHLPLIIEASV
jgi:endonuclease/exonuclease/phosphatase family metal-dependent hydrolase